MTHVNAVRVHLSIAICNIDIKPCACSDWSKTHVLQEYKTEKKRILLFCICKRYSIKQIKKPKPFITL